MGVYGRNMLESYFKMSSRGNKKITCLIPTNHLNYVLNQSSIEGEDDKTLTDAGMSLFELNNLRIDVLLSSPVIEKIQSIEKINLEKIAMLEERLKLVTYRMTSR